MNPQTKALVRVFRREVADDLTERLRADEAAERPRMSPADQRQFGRQLINRRLEQLRQGAARAGRRAALLRGRDGARAGGPRRPVRARRAPAAARRRVDREHRRQRARRRLGHPLRRVEGAGARHRRQRRGARRDAAHDGRPGRPHRAPVRQRVAVAQPAAARRQPAVRGHGRDVQAVRRHPAPPLPEGVPRRPGRPRVHRRGAARVPGRRGAGPQELHRVRRRRRREDHADAGDAQRGRPRGAHRHHRGQPRARPRPLPRPAPRRRGPRGPRGERRGRGRDRPGRRSCAGACG